MLLSQAAMASKLVSALLPLALGFGGAAGCEREAPTPERPAAREAPVPGGPVTPPATPEETATIPAEAARTSALLAAINESRRRARLRPLSLDGALSRAARERATDMRQSGYFAHISPSGETPFEVMAANGYDYSRAGENLARGLTDPTRIEDAWMDSRPHRRNILNPEFQDVGIALSGDLVVALFGRRAAPRTDRATRSR